MLDEPRCDLAVSQERQPQTMAADATQRTRYVSVLAVVATNLKDCPPFASLHRKGLTATYS